ncbi:MAG: RnfABCDGE type electron transport complex subunit D [Spartobacteria bacterium]|nr:RnfABCDGE type electron transport complex subunit D [Spartobacteria bacterium]
MSTQGMMRDVLVGLVPLILTGLVVFRGAALAQMVICVAACVAAELVFTAMRKGPVSIKDGSAAVTGMILALSLPATAPWFVGVLGSVVAIGLSKVIFGGLGQNLFNPAMVGRAFVMIAFPAMIGASAYVVQDASVHALTMATPLTSLKMSGVVTPLGQLLTGATNGSIGETGALACLLGGIYLCWRRAAAWQIPVAVIASAAVISLLSSGFSISAVLHELSAGALLFGAFFIATDPVTSPVTPRGRWIFGIGVGCFIMMLRKLSGYPEGVMFAVLLMNAVVPLINRWTIPEPLGGPVPVRN